jgi:hypothetical protein
VVPDRQIQRGMVDEVKPSSFLNLALNSCHQLRSESLLICSRGTVCNAALFIHVINLKGAA